MKLDLGTLVYDGRKTKLDLEIVLRSNLLLQAASGGGKSWALRRIAEQACQHVPVGIIDVEGEFASLREKYPFVLIGPGGETPADPRTAAMVATRMLELGVSFVADIFELPKRQRLQWVKTFLETLVNAPKKLWRDLLLLLDEAHLYAPEGARGEHVALEAVVDFAARGRKRGYGLVCATQRLGKFSKDVSAELKNVLIGQATLDIDRERAADALGKKVDRKTKEAFYKELRMMEPGVFYALGRALTPEPELVCVGDIVTTHPKPGRNRRAKPPPPLSRVKALLPQLADLPQEAENKLQTEAELRAEIKRLRGELKRQPVPPAVKVKPKIIYKTPPKVIKGLERLMRDVRKFRETMTARIAPLDPMQELLQECIDAGMSAQETGERMIAAGATPLPPSREVATARGMNAAFERAAAPDPTPFNGAAHLGRGERRVLIAIAQHENGVTRKQLTILTGYTRSSRNTYIQRLGAAGYIEIDDRIRATPAGIAALGSSYQPLPTGSQLRAYYQETLPKGEREVLNCVLQVHPSAMSREEISDTTGYTRSSRNTYIQRLGARELIETSSSGVRACDTLFD